MKTDFNDERKVVSQTLDNPVQSHETPGCCLQTSEKYDISEMVK